jgi:hypothetical protein
MKIYQKTKRLKQPVAMTLGADSTVWGLPGAFRFLTFHRLGKPKRRPDYEKRIFIIHRYFFGRLR